MARTLAEIDADIAEIQAERDRLRKQAAPETPEGVRNNMDRKMSMLKDDLMLLYQERNAVIGSITMQVLGIDV